MRRIAFVLVLVMCFVGMLADAQGFVANSSPEEEYDRLLAAGISDYFPFFKKKQAGDLDITHPELSFLRVSNISSASATITWVSQARCAGVVEYGPTTSLGQVVKERRVGRVHFLQLKDLPPGETIYYRVISGEAESQTFRFQTAKVGAGLPRVVYGALPQEVSESRLYAVAKLEVMGPDGISLPLATRFYRSGMWMLNLGNLKSTSGQVFSYHDDMTAEIAIQGIGPDGKPTVLLSYKVRLGDIKDGDLSRESGVVSSMLSAGPALISSPWTEKLRMVAKPIGPEPPAVSPERLFLEQLLSKGAQARREGRKGHGQPHIIPGWRGGSTMGPSKPPEPGPVPTRVRLRGEEVLKEIVRLRRERTDAADFFPDAARHFPHLRSGKDVFPVQLYQGINIVALPVDPYTEVSSYSFLQDDENAQEVTAWDGELQQFGATAMWVGGEIVGTDFPFILGYGYFVTMDSTGEATFEGDPFTAIKYVPIHAGLEVVSLLGCPDSVTSYTVFDGFFDGSQICRISPELQTYECAFIGYHGMVFGDEFPLEQGTGYFVQRGEAGFFPADEIAPSLTVTAPVDGDEIYTRQPFVEIIFGDHEWGLDLGTFSCLINGEDKTSFFTLDELGASWQMSGGEELAESTNTIEVTISDLIGNERNVLSTFDVVTTPPPEDEHFVNGYVFHGDTWEPLEGVAVTLESIPGVIYTDTSGHYVFSTPGLGEYRINIEKELFTYAQRYLSIEHGHGDVFVDDAYLSPKDSVVTRITPQGGVAVNSEGSIFTSFPPAVVDEDIDAFATEFDDTEDLPSPMPELAIFTYCADFGPEGETLSDSAFVDQLNWRGFSEGTPIPIGHFNPETMRWEDEGTAYVGADSTWFEFGLRHFSPVDVNLPVRPPPPPPTFPPQGQPKVLEGQSKPPKDHCFAGQNAGSPSLGYVKSKFGGCLITHDLSSVRSLGLDRSLSFAYSSHKVQPRIVIETGTDGIPSPYLLPQYTGAQVDLAGRRFTGIIEATRDTARQRIRFDAVGVDGEFLPTGGYYYRDFLANFTVSQYATAEYFGGPPVDSTGVWTDFPVGFRAFVSGDVIADNRVLGEIGAGWQLNKLQRLYLRPDGDVMIVEGGGPSHFYERIYPSPILDLAVAIEREDAIKILLGDGEGGFGESQDYAVGERPSEAAAGDFNGDQVLDLAVTNWGDFGHEDDYVTVLLGYGDGSFGDRQDYQVGDGPGGIVAADFNGDEVPDLAVENGRESDVSILLGYGDGSFGDRQDYQVGDSPSGIVVGDFNGDEVLDLAVGTGYTPSERISIVLGDGEGGFGEPQDFPVGTYPVQIVASDFNGDNSLDLAVTIQLEDAVSILLGDGEGGLSEPQDYPAGSWPYDVAAGDFNGDLILDLAVTDYYGYCVSVLVGDGEGGFGYRQEYSVGEYPLHIVARDFNGDEVLDLAVTNQSDYDLSVLKGDGTGGFGDRQDYALGDMPRGLVTGNFNGDFSESGFRSQDGDFTKLIINADSISYTRIYPDSSKVVFDSAGLHVATIDRNANTTAYEYDELNRLITVTYPGSLVTHLEYGPDGYLEVVTDPGGRVTEFDHDANGNLISITDPDSSVWQYEYDDDHLLTKIIDPRNNETIYEYDTNGYVTRIVGPSSSTNDFLPSDGYNTLNEAIAQGQGTPENPAPVVLPDDLINMFVNTLGDTTTSLTNAYGRRTMKLDPLGRIHRKEYDVDGNITAMTRPDSTRLSYTYDEFGNPLTMTEESIGATTSVVYDSVYHLPIRIEDALGNVTKIDRDDRGNPIRIINALDDTTFSSYDSRGLVTKTINPLGDSTVYEYDEQGRLITVTDHLGLSTHYEYDLAGNVTAVIDANSYRTEYEYDSMNRLTLTRDALNHETVYDYDENGNLVALANAKSDTTHFTHDAYNRRTSVTDPLAHIEQYDYNSEGLLTRRINPNGDSVAYFYDQVHRLVQKILPEDSSEYEYDLVGNLIKVEDSDSRILYCYDDARRLTSVETGDSTNPAIAQPYVISDYTRDLNGNITERVDSEGDTVGYIHDALNRVVGIAAQGDTTFYAYDAAARLDFVIRSNGTISDYIFDAAGQLLDLAHVLSGDSIAVFHYQYDSVGNRTGLADLDGSHTFTYDSLYQLIGATHPQVYNPTEDYSYDEVGNRDSSHLSTSYSYDACNRLLEDDDYEYGWDDAGRQVWKRTVSTGDTAYFTYTPDDQLIRVHNDSIDVWYAYDGAGKRIQKMIVSNGGSDTAVVKYSHDGADLLFEHDETESLQVRYLFGPGIDNILESRDQSGTYLHFSDALGSVAKITDASGTEVKSLSYDGFGNIVSSTGSASADEISYTGRKWEQELGLYYYRARYYDPTTGRFISTDPIGAAAGDVNFYRYVRNNPLNFVDPLGLNGKCKIEPENAVLEEEIYVPYGPHPGLYEVYRIEKLPWLEEVTYKIMNWVYEKGVSKTFPGKAGDIFKRLLPLPDPHIKYKGPII